MEYYLDVKVTLSDFDNIDYTQCLLERYQYDGISSSRKTINISETVGDRGYI